MLLCAVLVCFVHDLCLVIIYTVLFVSIVFWGYLHVVFCNNCFVSCVELLDKLAFLILYSDCFLMHAVCASLEIAFKNSHSYY